jgi:cyclophilin family peptidyl-prolyl cis-trans isomerase
MKQFTKHLSFAAVLMLLVCTAMAQEKEAKKTSAKPTTEKSAMSETKGKEIVVMETSMGTIELEMYRSDAPKTVENFVQLARKGYYNGIIFHRVIDAFMIQGGDPTGTGMAGESIYGAKFDDEISPKRTFEKAGILAMANAGKSRDGHGTNGSQFFITLAPTTWLNGNHTIFGEVVAGMDVVKAIGKVQVKKPGDKPVTDVVMKKVYVKGEKPAPAKAAEQK